MLPVFFIVLASAALLAALTALFASLRAAIGGGADDLGLGGMGPDLGALEDEKNALLRALKDLEYEHEVGKIDDEDYARLERAYRARAKEVLGELDRDFRPYLSRAEELAGGASVNEKKKAKKKKKGENLKGGVNDGRAARLGESESPAESEGEGESTTATSAPAPAAPAVPIAPHVCSKCATVNDPDARFCKKCATPLAEAAP